MPQYVRTPYAPDQRTLLDLMRLASRERSQADVQKAAIRAQGLMSIGQLIAGTLASMRQDRAAQEATAVEAQRQQQADAMKVRDQELREADLLAREQERQDAAAARAEAAREKASADAYKRGGDVAEDVGYGPMSELQLDSVMQGPAAGRARYAFGPGTAEGPELQPTQAQREALTMREQLTQMGYAFGPNGQVIPPPKPESKPQPTEWSVLLEAAGGDPRKALALRQQQQQGNKAPEIPDQKFVIRNGQVVPITAGQAQPGDIPYSAEAMQGMGGESADARAMRTAAALNSIDTLKELAPKRVEGPVGMLQGAYESGKGALGYNTQVKQYNALLGPTAMQMAVAIQGAAGLSNAEREVMKGMLGNIATMDYTSQMALLERASQLVRGGADVDLVDLKDPKTGEVRQQWAPRRSRMPGSVTLNSPQVETPSRGPSVGTVLQRGGKSYRVTKVYPDGTFDADEVKP